MVEHRDPSLPARPSVRPADYGKTRASLSSAIEDNHSTAKRRKKTKKPKNTVYIETLTISANGPPLETHLKNTKGPVHIRQLKIEDDTVVSSNRASHKSSRRRRSRREPAEKETEGISKLTRVCELACVASLILQYVEYKSKKS
jgi:hypothetical protein